MLDAVIISIFVLALAGVGYEAIDLAPPDVLTQVTNIEAVRLIIASFGAIVGLAFGLTAQTTYRRLEATVRSLPIETILTRAIGWVLGLLLANLMLAPIFLLPIPDEFSLVKPLSAVLVSVMFSFLGVSLADTHGRTFLRLINPSSIETLLSKPRSPKFSTPVASSTGGSKNSSPPASLKAKSSSPNLSSKNYNSSPTVPTTKNGSGGDGA